MSTRLIGKIFIKAQLKLLTGLHIGGGGDFSAIGAVDNVVVRDVLTKEPIIPGSSLKGKSRALISKIKHNDYNSEEENKKNSEELFRLFGSKGNGPIVASRLQFFDTKLTKESKEALELADTDLPYTEIKYENTINSVTSIANPRQQERVPASSVFDFNLTYNIEDVDEIKEDFKNINLALRTLEDDYLGGHGTRGYGRISFNNLKINNIKIYNDENLDISVEDLITELNSILDKTNA